MRIRDFPMAAGLVIGALVVIQTLVFVLEAMARHT
jgi:hypothetical protein